MRLFVLLALTAALVFAFGTAAFSEETVDAECYLTGDMNADGQLTSADAVHLLYFSVEADGYTVNQPANVNGDAAVDAQDAIDLLYALFGLDEENDCKVTLGETVHDYYDPAWTWTEEGEGFAVTATFKCACGKPVTETVTNITCVDDSNVATCAAPGSAVWEARVTFAGETWTNQYTQWLPAKAHTAGEDLYYDGLQHYHKCAAGCDVKLDVQDHIWEKVGDVVKGNCTNIESTQAYKCRDCEATKTEKLGLVDHLYDIEDVVVNGCQRAKQYKCRNCDDSYYADHYYQHEFAAVVTKEATCLEDGEKQYKCTKCGEVDASRTTVITHDAKKDHKWGDPEVKDGKTVQTCECCLQKKTLAVADDNGEVDAETLKGNDAVSVGGTTMSMDDTVKGSLEENAQIKITVDEIAKDKVDVALTQEQLAQIPGNVYDFNMTVNGEKVSNFGGGSITITLPYKLAEGEDIDAIDVWYIADNGELEKRKATYSNGYITFTAEHFSYYTVTRLTAEERCQRYGHIWEDCSKQATCTTPGYTSQVCQRCKQQRNDEEFKPETIPVLGHNYDGVNPTVTAATCTEAGSESRQCTRCSFLSVTVIAPAGHTLSTQTTEATCEENGKMVTTCENCDHTVTETLPKLTHQYEHTQTVDATCTMGGWKVHTCVYCGDTVKKDVVPALGHDASKGFTWNWDDPDEAASITLNCCGKQLSASVTDKAATCTEDATATAKIWYNGIQQEKTLAYENTALDHDYEDFKWHSDENTHFNRCKNCGDTQNVTAHSYQVNVIQNVTCTSNGLEQYTCECGHSYTEELAASGEHAMNDGVVTKAATCTADGERVYSCANCDYSYSEAIPATGHTEGAGQQTLAPSCTGQGVMTYYCETCGAVIKNEPIAALGHSKDTGTRTEPTCTANGVIIYNCTICNKEVEREYLDATGHSQEHRVETVVPSCTSQGSVTRYCQDCDAEISREITPATGHTKDAGTRTEPTCTAQGVIIYCCTTCSKEVERVYLDVAPHTMDNGVEKIAPGCTTSGLLVYSCVNCDYSYSKQIEATGHNMVNSVCSICGQSAGCDHKDVLLTEVELPEGVCGGKLYWSGCACNNHRLLTLTTMGCQFELDMDTMTEYSYVIRCKECGLRFEVTRTLEYLEDPCVGRETMFGQLIFNGEVLTEVEETIEHAHMLRQDATWQTVSGLGMCDLEVRIRTCSCGYVTQTEYKEYCNWIWESADHSVQICTKCSTLRRTSLENVYLGDCQYLTTQNVIFTTGSGNEIYRIVNMSQSVEHKMKAEATCMLGDSCSDGWICVRACANCGEIECGLSMNHETNLVEHYDLTQYGMCGGYVDIYACACGEESTTFVNDYCKWETDYKYTGEGEGYLCCVCGMKKVVVRNFDHMSHCVQIETVTTTYLDFSDQELLTYEQQMTHIGHVYSYTEQLKGESCTDGVEITGTCDLCGESESYTVYYHRTTQKRTEYGEKYGMCGFAVVEEICACGQEGKGSWIERNGCMWVVDPNYVGSANAYTHAEYCTVCNAHYVLESETIFTSACGREMRTTVTITNSAGEEVYRVVNTSPYTSHTYETTTKLLGQTCMDGVEVTNTCVNCGESNSSVSYWHVTVQKRTEYGSDDGVCGVVLIEEACPCGQQNNGTRIEPYGCNWVSVDTWSADRYCTHCNATLTTSYKSAMEGCTEKHYQVTTYASEFGDVVCEYRTLSHQFENHRYHTTVTLNGTTCSDGYEAVHTCVNCGNSYSQSGFACESFRYYTYYGSDYGVCGVMHTEYRCACGMIKTDSRIEPVSCKISGMWEDGESECSVCHAVYKQETNAVRDENCFVTEYRTVTFTNADGDVLYQDESVNNAYEDHTFITEVTMYGTICMDGYLLEKTCTSCGYTQSDEFYYCNTISYVTTYGSEHGICGVTLVEERCPCGQNNTARIEAAGCVWQLVSGDGWSGDATYVCTTCDATYERITERVQEGCMENTYKVNRYTNADGEVVCEHRALQGSMVNHQYSYTVNKYGESCMYGYDVIYTCDNCGYSYSNYYTYCVTEPVRTEYGSEHGVCGIVVEEYRCICCDQVTQAYIYENGCMWEFEAVSPDMWNTDMPTGHCTICGGVYQRTTEKVQEGCVEREYAVTRYTNGDGELVYEYRRLNSEKNNHNYETTVNLYGITCMDGYEVVYTCVHCGDTYTTSGMSCMTFSHRTYYGSDDGVCGVTLVENRCACGQFSNGGWIERNECNWVEHPDSKGPATDLQMQYCTECQAIYVWKIESSWDNECVQRNTTSTTYTNAAGELLCDLSNSITNTYHDYRMTVNMHGQSCTDGYEKVYTCTKCGDSYSHSYSWHMTEQYTSVYGSDHGVCGITVYEDRCACGQEKMGIRVEATGCTWEYDGTYSVDSDSVLNFAYRCTTCGGRSVQLSKYYGEGECVDVCEMITFCTNGLDEVIHSYNRSSRVGMHNYTSSKKLLGDSCADGVETTYSCVTCGHSYAEVSYGHQIQYEYIDLNNAGMCGGWVSVSECLCGQEGNTYYGFNCMFWFVETVDGVSTYHCDSCGTNIDVRCTQNDVNECHTIRKYDCAIYNKSTGEQILEFAVWRHDYRHWWVNELTLSEGGTSCTDGVAVREHCVKCGETGQTGLTLHEHWQFAVAREALDEALCDGAQKVTYSCGCGQEGYVAYQLDGCKFAPWGYDEELGYSVERCDGCGTIRYYSEDRKPVDGEPCKIEVITITHFLLNGAEIFNYQISNIQDNHQYIKTFDMHGQTCEDGYTVYEECANCDIRYEWGYYTHCNQWLIDREYLVDEGYCSKVYVDYYSCPCGQSYRQEVYTEGNCCFVGNYEEAFGCYVYVCETCGLTYTTQGYQEVMDPQKPCDKLEGTLYTYYAADGSMLASAIGGGKMTYHRYLSSYDEGVEDCQQEYTVYQICRDCGYTSQFTAMGCDNRLVDVQLKLEDDQYCCAVYEYFYSCVCGRNSYSSVEFEGNCSFENIWDEQIGDYVYRCSTCGLIKQNEYVPETVDPDDRCCRISGTNIRFYDAQYNELCCVETRSRYQSHTTVYSYQLRGTTCDEGYDMYQQCVYCDYQSYWGYDSGCMTRRVGFEELLVGDYCTKVYKETYRCACGENGYSNTMTEFNCDFDTQYVEALGCDAYVCNKCGLIRRDEYFNVAIDPAQPCYRKEGTRYTYYDAAATVICVAESVMRFEIHSYEASFSNVGETCEDGYWVTQTCQDCGKVEDLGEHRGCNQWLIDRETKLDDSKYCSKIYSYTYGCPCGNENRVGYAVSGGCVFEEHYDASLDRYLYTCATCGLTYRMDAMEDQVNPEKPCHVTSGTLYTFSDAQGTDLFVVCNTWKNENHHQVFSFANMGETCDDGYTVMYRCIVCGIEGEWGVDAGCNARVVDIEIKLENSDYCSAVYQYTYSCACGKKAYVDCVRTGECEMSGRHDETLDCWIEMCVNCGLRYQTQSNISVPNPETPCNKVETMLYTYYDRDGDLLFTAISTSKIVSHEYLHTFTDVGETCADGFHVIRTCQDCGYSYDMGEYYDCGDWLLEKTLVIDSEDYCSKVYLCVYGCPCGASNNKERFTEGNCNFNSVHDETLGCDVYTCSKCGLYYTEVFFTEVIDPQTPCQRRNGYRYTYYAPNGEVLCVVEDDWRSQSHECLYSYELMGTTCADGVNVYRSCRYCDYREEFGMEYTCESRLTAITTVVDSSAGYCSDVLKAVYSCGCGELTSTELAYTQGCNFEWVYNEQLQCDVRTCTECGLTYYTEHIWQTIDPERPCNQIHTKHTIVLDADGNELYRLTRSENVESHTYTHTFKLFGTTCSDGYEVYGTCIYCHYISDAETCYDDCNRWLVERYALEQYGMCGGHVSRFSCACGDRSYFGYDLECDYVWTGKYNEDGVEGCYCADCKTTFYIEQRTEMNRTACRESSVFFVELVRNQETVLDVTMESSQTRHTYLVDHFVGTCGDSVTTYEKCYYCGDERTESCWSEGHLMYLVDLIDLDAAGACGGLVEFYQCVCGKYQDYYIEGMQCSDCKHESSEVPQPDGNTLYKETMTCAECGVKLHREWTYTHDPETCQRVMERTIWVSIGGEELGTFTEWETEIFHNYSESYTLAEGSTSCVDGVIASKTCQDCGDTTEWTTKQHMTCVRDRIDLSAYGSACGAYLERSACACGQYQSYGLGGVRCDLDDDEIDCWIEGALNGWNETTEGDRNYESDSHIYTCAVTDPQCALKIRMTTCWLQNGCEAVKYQIWQLGYRETYDEETDQWTYSWDEEIRIATGERRTYHAYAHTYECETTDDDVTVDINSYVCSVCGSSIVGKSFYESGIHVGYEKTIINLLDNGETKKYVFAYEEALLSIGIYNRTYEKWYYLYADETEYWEENTYEYQFELGCQRVRHWKDSDGESRSEVETHGRNWGYDGENKKPTCSQPGEHVIEWHCDICDGLVEYEYYQTDPNGHCWCWNTELELYVCCDCGMESTNDADGTIILEDLTDSNGTDYVIGYWNQGDAVFTPYISVILLDSNGEICELVLNGIEFIYLTVENDGIQAISINQALVQEAAAAAILEEGYTGDFVIRVTFVPMDGEGELDYAITFDGQMADGGAE